MKLEWVPTRMIGGKKWYLYAMPNEPNYGGYKEIVMYLSAHHKVSPGKPRRFIGWDVYRIATNATWSTPTTAYATKVGPRIFRLKKAQEFAEVIWRMG